MDIYCVLLSDTAVCLYSAIQHGTFEVTAIDVCMYVCRNANSGVSFDLAIFYSELLI
jgi:hypothetical protein